jgi:hypothetical protein
MYRISVPYIYLYDCLFVYLSTYLPIYVLFIYLYLNFSKSIVVIKAIYSYHLIYIYS